MNATQGSEVHLHQTEPPNALRASERCPGQPSVDWEFITLTTAVRLRSWRRPSVTNFFGIVKIAELASQGFWPFDRAPVVIRSRIAAL